MGEARILQRGGHTESYRGYSPDCHLNIVGCLPTKRLTKGEGVTAPQDPPLVTPLPNVLRHVHSVDRWSADGEANSIPSPNFVQM